MALFLVPPSTGSGGGRHSWYLQGSLLHGLVSPNHVKVARSIEPVWKDGVLGTYRQVASASIRVTQANPGVVCIGRSSIFLFVTIGVLRFRLQPRIRVDRQLLADRQVRFAGYMQPHPLENKIHIKVTFTICWNLAGWRQRRSFVDVLLAEPSEHETGVSRETRKV